jgi:hypothetical protein
MNNQNTVIAEHKAAIEYKISNESDNNNLVLDDDGNIVRNPQAIFWAEIEISVNDNKINIAAQYDCGNSWCYYNLGGDGESIETTYDHFFESLVSESEREEFETLLEQILEEAEPDLSITEYEIAEFINENFDEDEHEFFSVVDTIHEIVPEKSRNWATIIAFKCVGKITSYGDFECNMQIAYGLTKAQTVELCHIL